MKMTISIEKGSGSLKHDFDKDYRKKQKHIVGDPNKNIVILQEDIKEVYKEKFEKAQIEYNDKQSRNDRKIKNYYEHLLKGKQEKVFQEIIITIGNIDNKDKEAVITEVYKEVIPILIKRYPNLIFFGAVIHLDEGGIAHAHLDFVPFITNSKRGLSTRVSMDGALKEMGFKPETSRLNLKSKRPIIFNGFRNDIERVIETSMKTHGIEHLDKYDDHNKMYPEEYRKLKKEEKEVQERVNQKKDEEKQIENEITSLRNEVSELETNKGNIVEETKQLRTETKRLTDKRNVLVEGVKELSIEASALKMEKEKTIEVAKRIKLSQKEIKAIPFRENTLNKAEVIIPKDDFEKLKNNQIRLIDKNNNITKKNEYLTLENEELLNDNEKLFSENEYLENENDELMSNNIMMDSYIKGKGLEPDYEQAKPMLSKLADIIKKPFNYIQEQYHKVIQTLTKFGLHISRNIEPSKFKVNSGLEELRHIQSEATVRESKQSAHGDHSI